MTLTSANICPRIENWHVMDECTLSDHLYIFFILQSSDNEKKKRNKSYVKWSHKKMDETMYNEFFEWVCTGEMELDVNNAATWLNETIAGACDAAMPRVKPHNKNSVYWWSQEIAAARRDCNKSRRIWLKRKIKL